MNVRTRFAPSPTGSLHVGGARTALYCLLHARKAGGCFLLRIEDTDQVRSTEAASAGLLRDLRWLALDWDEGPGRDGGAGPYYQSQRLDIYDTYVRQLLASGHAYEAWDSPAELDALRKEAEAAKRSFRYRQRPADADQVAAWRAEGRRPVVRLRAPAHDIDVQDDILGLVTVTADELEDIVIRKADGFPTYHFAVVIDDHLMQVSHILRGQEHLLNTPKHLGIYEALGWDPPHHGHLPLIFNPGGAKMSKRDKAKVARTEARRLQSDLGISGLASATGVSQDLMKIFVDGKSDDIGVAQAIASAFNLNLPMIEVMDFRVGGYLPEALLNYLALLGWSPGDDREILRLDEMIAAFDISAINKTAARFDPDKLLWMNAEYIRSSSLNRLLRAARSRYEVVPGSPLSTVDDPTLTRFLALYQQRLQTLADLDRMARFFFDRPTSWDPKATSQHLLKGDGLAVLAAISTRLAALPTWSADTIDGAIHTHAAETGLGLGKIAQPLRVAVTGTAVSPPIGETLEILGQPETLVRIHATLASLQPGG